MTREQKKQYIFGTAVILAVVIFIFLAYCLMGRTNIADVSMDPYYAPDWSYEIISGSEASEAAPVFVDEYTVAFPGESGRAVRAKRLLKEKLGGARLGVYLYEAVCGVDILLDGELFYTSFEGAPRDGAGLAVTDGLGPAERGTHEIDLPEDYLGRELTVVTYFPEETSDIIPVFPYLSSVDAKFSVTSVENVWPVAGATVCAILAFLTALIYVLDISNGKADKKVLLLTLFYLMMFLATAFSSLAGSYSLLAEKLNALDFLCELYIAPLLMFAAFCMTSWRRWILAAATGLWFVADSIRLIRLRLIVGPFYGQASVEVILLLYLLVLAMAIVEMKLHKEKRPKRSDAVYLLVAAMAATLRIILYSSHWNWDASMYILQLVVNPLNGYFYPLVQFISYVCATTATVAVAVEFVKRTVRNHKLMNVLEEQSRQAMDSYRRMEEAAKATNAARHEMRHHLLALQGMLSNGNASSAEEYIASVSDGLDALPSSRYSRNMMVNVIAGSYLDRAAGQGVKIKYSLDLPEKLAIADNDLCVLVTNVLENAVEACERMDKNEEKFINIKMSLDGGVLFLGCENSRPSGEAETESGYGMENMSRVAEKYGGIVKAERKPSSFVLTSYLNI